jgi:DNA-directed RNA polymerase subunit RPC12/RpoP
MSQKFVYQCSDCGLEIPAGEIIYLCPVCSAKQQPNQPPLGVLKVVYNFLVLNKPTFRELVEEKFLQILPHSRAEKFTEFAHWHYTSV